MFCLTLLSLGLLELALPVGTAQGGFGISLARHWWHWTPGPKVPAVEWVVQLRRQEGVVQVR